MKTIVNFNTEDDIIFKDVHRIKGAVFTNYRNRLESSICYKKAWYDHYYTKSWEDWCERFSIRGDVCPGNVFLNEFFDYNTDISIDEKRQLINSFVDQNKKYQYIPKLIHYCWFGKGNKPAVFNKCIASWKKYLPDYEIIEWNEDNFDINICPFVAEAYNKKKFAFVSDYARLYAVYNYGGIYFDTDVELLKRPSDNLLDTSFIGTEKYYNDINTGQGFGANKHNFALGELINFYNRQEFKQQITSNVVTEYFTKNGYIKTNLPDTVIGFKILSDDFMCPVNPISGEKTITKNTFSIHHFMASWLDELDLQNIYKDRVFEYNNTKPSDEKKRKALLPTIFDYSGSGSRVFPPIYANYGCHYVHLGNNVFINMNCTFVDDTDIYIDDNVSIGPNVNFITTNHNIDPSKRNEKYKKEIHICTNVWIGACAIILPGITIGENSVIGAGSVVTKDIPANVVAAGNPCKVIKNIK